MLLNTSTSIFCTFQFPFDIKFNSLMQENYLQMPMNSILVTIPSLAACNCRFSKILS